jgi:hypothetical protein
MHRPIPFFAVALAALMAASISRGDPMTSANYAMNTTFDGGGHRVTSNDYDQIVTITPLSGRSVTTFSVVMFVGFGSQLNNPPIAVDDVRSHPLDAGVNITGSSLFANDFDPDGDALILIGVDATSAAGGALSMTGQSINYTPPAALSGADHFQYVVADSNGDIATATVTLGIAPPLANQPINTVLLSEQSDGKLLVRFRQQTGRSDYIIQVAHDLANPDWQTVTDVHAGVDGIVEILLDPGAAAETYFRAIVF